MIFKWDDKQKQVGYVDENIGFVREQQQNKKWYVNNKHGLGSQWEVYSFIKLSLSVEIYKGEKFIVPKIQEIKDEEEIKRNVGKHCYKTFTSIQKTISKFKCHR
eukprot:447001_1